jgi:hypothetical protein
MKRTLIAQSVVVPVVTDLDPAIPFTSNWNAVMAVSPTGHINPTVIGDDTDNKTYTVPSAWPISIPLGHAIWGGVTCWNDSGASVKVKCTIWFVDPNGSTKGSYSDTGTIAAGGAHAVATASVPLDKAGVWTLYAKMELA